MKLLLLFTTILALAFADDLRTIMFNETTIVKLTRAQIDALALDPSIPGFMDITDFPDRKQEKQQCNYMPAPTKAIRGNVVKALFTQIQEENVKRIDTQLADYFNRYYTTADGEASAQWLLDTAQGYATAAGRSDVEVKRFSHTWRQPSIIATIPGTSSEYGDYRVVFGAHEDSTSGGASRRAPGACDNASGSAAIMEVFRLLMNNDFRPDRTVEIQWYAAEEVGLLGSAAIANAYKDAGVCVEAMYNYDMVGYWANNQKRIRVINDAAYTDAAFNTFLSILIDEYSDLPQYNSGYGRAASDHASWARAGYRACHAKESGNYSPIHTPNDVPSNLDFEYSVEFVKVGLGWVYEMGFIPDKASSGPQ